MLIRGLVLGIFSFGMMILGAGVVLGQVYPNKPIRIIISEAGGGADVVARIIAQEISGLLTSGSRATASLSTRLLTLERPAVTLGRPTRVSEIIPRWRRLRFDTSLGSGRIIH